MKIDSVYYGEGESVITIDGVQAGMTIAENEVKRAIRLLERILPSYERRLRTLASLVVKDGEDGVLLKLLDEFLERSYRLASPWKNHCLFCDGYFPIVGGGCEDEDCLANKAKEALAEARRAVEGGECDGS